MWLIFINFIILGCISFGGPVAHLGYFRKTFVQKLGWIDDRLYVQLITLSQFLPGPSSSQVGFAIGYHRKGTLGGIAAFLGFTAPSFLIMLLLAMSSDFLSNNFYFTGATKGLKLLAVIIVADAVYGMYISFCKSRLTSIICFTTSLTLFLIPGIHMQITALILSAITGSFLLRNTPKIESSFSGINYIALITFILILAITFIISSNSHLYTIFSDFYQTGSLVFGGGHVVLPLLQGLLGDQISHDKFLVGYVAAQAVPGPMFSLSAYLGYEIAPSANIIASFVSTIGIFLPGFLLLIGLKNAWHGLLDNPLIAGAATAINASVVGLILMALYNPVIKSSVHTLFDLLLALSGFYFLKKLKIIYLVIIFSLFGLLFNYLKI